MKRIVLLFCPSMERAILFSPLKFILALLLFAALSVTCVLHAQQPLTGPSGGPIDRIINNPVGSNLPYSCFPWNKHDSKIYGVIDSVHSKLLYAAPKGQKIEDCELKSLFGIYYFVVLLSDSTVQEFDFETGETTTKDIKVQNAGDWEEIAGDALYVLTTRSVYVSRDNGATWQLDNVGLNGDTLNHLALDASQRVYLATQGGLYEQDSNGTSWTKVSSLAAANLVSVFVDRMGRIYVGGSGGAYMSTNGGTTWTSDSAGLSMNTPVQFADDYKNNIYAIANNHLYISSGGTQPWREIDAGILSQTVNVTTFNSIVGDTEVFAGTSFGLFISTDQGGTWTQSQGIPAQDYYGIWRTGGKLFASTSLGLFGTTTNDTTWSKTYPSNGFMGAVQAYADPQGDLYVQDSTVSPGYKAHALLKSTNNGGTWALDTVGLYQVNGSLFYIDETGAQHYSNTYNGQVPCLLWERPVGGSWEIDTAGFIAGTYMTVSSMCSDGKGYLYISGNFFNNEQVLRRPIGGGAWVVDTAGIPLASVSPNVIYFTQMVAAPNGDVFATDGYSLWRRTGGSWSRIAFPTQVFAHTLSAISVDANGVLFAALNKYNQNYPPYTAEGGEGVYYTKDFGATWTYAGLNYDYVTSLVSYNDTTYALTQGDGAYKMSATPASSVASEGSISTPQYSLTQSYPNPFIGTATISYRVLDGAFATLKIYDALGREVAQPVTMNRQPGLHFIAWDATEKMQGVYYYRYSTMSAQTGALLQSETGKLIYLK